MTNKTYTVVKDLSHDHTGTPSTVGQEVTTIVVVPAGTRVVITDQDGGKGFARVSRDVYLTVGGSSRISDKFGKVAVCTFTVCIDGKTYAGNDVYSAEELGIVK